jgi:magnesium transporter
VLTEELTETVIAAIERRDWSAASAAATELDPPQIADLLLEMQKSDRVLLFRVLPRDIASEAFAYLGSQDKNALLKELTDEETRSLLADLSPDDRTALLSELPGQVVQRALTLLSPGDLAEARWLLGYPEDSVGRLMTPDYVAVRPDWTLARVLEHIRAFGQDRETINRIYVVDDRWHLIDDIELRRVILADPTASVQAIMDNTFAAVSATADREEAVNLIRHHDLDAVPVVDSRGVLVGIVTVDDVLDVAEEEATEDFHRVASVDPLRVSLREAGILYLYRRRIFWLLTLVVMNVFSGAGIAYFEDTIAATVALVFFLPLLIDSAGNAGAQAATLMVRAMATGDVRPHDWLQLAGREMGVATALGGSMAIAVSVVAMFRGGPDLAVVVAATMVLVVLVGSLVGMSLPFLLSRFGMDPATASAPLVTSIADISGVLIYFSIATWYLAPAPPP